MLNLYQFFFPQLRTLKAQFSIQKNWAVSFLFCTSLPTIRSWRTGVLAGNFVMIYDRAEYSLAFCHLQGLRLLTRVGIFQLEHRNGMVTSYAQLTKNTNPFDTQGLCRWPAMLITRSGAFPLETIQPPSNVIDYFSSLHSINSNLFINLENGKRESSYKYWQECFCILYPPKKASVFFPKANPILSLTLSYCVYASRRGRSTQEPSFL